MNSINHRKIERVDLAIVQPRAPGEKIKTHTISLMELLDFETELREAVRRIDETPNLRVAGDWCRFCPALATCETARNRVADITIAPYAHKLKEGYESINLELLALNLERAAYVEEWLNAVWALSEKLALTGTKIPRHKLVAGRGSRTWKFPPGVVIQAVQRLGITAQQ